MTTSESAAHVCWSAEPTGYLRALSPEEREAWAVHYQKAPVRNNSGSTSYSLNFPVLIVTAYSAKPDKVAARVAAILNKHWDDLEFGDAA